MEAHDSLSSSSFLLASLLCHRPASSLGGEQPVKGADPSFLPLDVVEELEVLTTVY